MKNGRMSLAHLGLAGAQDDTETHPQALRFGRMLGRCWLVTHLACLAGIGACLWQAAPTVLLTGWSSFVLLNVLLREVLLAMPARLDTPRDHRHLDLALAAVLGLAWGLGIALLMPYADAATIATLLSGALAVALVAVPVFGDEPGAYAYFLGSTGLVAIGGLVHDGRYANLVLWVALAMATLALLNNLYRNTHRALRVLLLQLRHLIRPAGPGCRLRTRQPVRERRARTRSAAWPGEP